MEEEKIKLTTYIAISQLDWLEKQFLVLMGSNRNDICVKIKLLNDLMEYNCILGGKI